ncbi:molybdate ABC transporter permease subunit [Persephonella atlantica]|uniref:Molybdenum transport system permease n=1 Tax=Persephonella atlantica TaxID=2699429 RepID=A0ABS1GIL1_9AQUI|nr:molybdate ABC transporter permease subunit [Persephonella atlantica]MBK3332762.1 molybdate ABC transporter permease subunit [Persephonella atlantica]
MDGEFLQTVTLTLRLAIVTTAILFIIGIPLSYFLAYRDFRLKPFIETVVSLPLVLPPTVLGFYFIVLFSPDGFIGKIVDHIFGIKMIFTFEGLVVGSIIYSLPFMIHPLQSGFQSVDRNIIEASYTLGKNRIETLFRVIMPNMKQSLLTGIVLTFAHTIGEFGVVLMIGGSIPGETKVASIAIYEEVEALNYDRANLYAVTLFVITFLILIAVYTVNKKFTKADSL